MSENSSNKNVVDKSPSDTKSFGLALPKKVASTPAENSSGNPQTGGTDKGVDTVISNTASSSSSAATTAATAAAAAKKKATDSHRTGGSLMLAGINVNEEEALLNEHNRKNAKNASMNNNKNNKAFNIVKPPSKTPFLHPVHVAKHVDKVIQIEKILKTRSGVSYDYAKSKPEILAQLSTACELYMKDIITSALIASRHRRKNIGHNTDSSSNAEEPQRSKVSRALRQLAQEERKLEERRLLMRQSNGLEEKNTVQLKATNVEETMAKASNATASLMTGGKKKYSWLTQSKNAASPSFASANTVSETVSGPIATAIKSRGEMGIKYREPREEPGIVMRDFLRALENRRVNPSIDAVVTKGYSRIRD